MAIFVAVVSVVTWAISFYFTGSSTGAYISIAIAIGYALFSYFSAGRLAVAMNGAKEIQKRDNPRLFRIVENLAITEGMPMPKVYIMDDQALNAFATGRNPQNAIVAATSGLMNATSDQELEAVMAHEMGHVKNYDIRVSMIAFALVSVISIVTQIGSRALFFGGGRDREGSNLIGIAIFIVSIVVAPLIANALRLSVSRRRELLADATGARTTRNPDALISALTKINSQGSQVKKASTATAHLFFANPLSKTKLANLFSTHPSYEARVSALKKISTSL